MMFDQILDDIIAFLSQVRIGKLQNLIQFSGTKTAEIMMVGVASRLIAVTVVIHQAFTQRLEARLR